MVDLLLPLSSSLSRHASTRARACIDRRCRLRRTVSTYARTMPTWNRWLHLYLLARETLYPATATVGRRATEILFLSPFSLSFQLSSVRPWRLTNPGRAYRIERWRVHARDVYRHETVIQISSWYRVLQHDQGTSKEISESRATERSGGSF